MLTILKHTARPKRIELAKQLLRLSRLTETLLQHLFFPKCKNMVGRILIPLMNMFVPLKITIAAITEKMNT